MKKILLLFSTLMLYAMSSLVQELYSYHFVVNGTDLLDPSNEK